MTDRALVLEPTPTETELAHIEADRAGVPMVMGAAVLTAPAVLKARLETYSASRKVLMAWIDENLVPGTDFQLLHRKLGPRGQKRDCGNKDDAKSKRCAQCGGKATLCKPGAEKIAGMLRLTPKFRRDQETWEMLGSTAGTVALVCELVDETGAIVAEGRGARTKDQDFGDVNKTVKMAEKSAATDAVLRCAGLSEVFSQDDPGDDRRQRKAKPEPKPKREAPPPSTEPTISEAQVKDIFTLLTDANKTEEWAMKKLGYGTKLEDIRVSDHGRVLEGIKRATGAKA